MTCWHFKATSEEVTLSQSFSGLQQHPEVINTHCGLSPWPHSLPLQCVLLCEYWERAFFFYSERQGWLNTEHWVKSANGKKKHVALPLVWMSFVSLPHKHGEMALLGETERWFPSETTLKSLCFASFSFFPLKQMIFSGNRTMFWFQVSNTHQELLCAREKTLWQKPCFL